MKKLITGILALSLTLCAFTSCGDENDSKSSSSAKSDDKGGNSVDSGDYPFESTLDMFIDSLNDKDYQKYIDAAYTDKYLSALKAKDEEAYSDLVENDGDWEELVSYINSTYYGEFSGESEDQEAEFSEDKVSWDISIKSAEKTDIDTLKDFEDKLAEAYEEVDLDRVSVTEGYKAEVALIFTYDGKENEADTEEMSFYHVDDEWISDDLIG